MTEQEWLACREPKPMLRFLKDKATDRKFRLFGIACCRQVWHLLASNECRHAVEISDRFADDIAEEQELRTACIAVAEKSKDSRGFSNPAESRAGAAYNAAFYASITKMWHVEALADATQILAARSGFPARQCSWLRDIHGNPFRPVTIEPAWLTWNDATVPKIAQAIYDDRRFADIPILADALEEAGCTDADILNHCRQPGEHVRGCWVVDLLLGKT